MRLFGIDFTSRPSQQKSITIASGRPQGSDALVLEAVDSLSTFAHFEHWLDQPGPWLAACDFPFGLPRELVIAQGWPDTWPALIRHYASQSRDTLRQQFRAFCDARPAGQKFAHRQVDLLARSSPSMNG